MKKLASLQSQKKERFDPIGEPPDKAAAKKKYEKNEKALRDTLDDILGTDKKFPPKVAKAPAPMRKQRKPPPMTSEPTEEEKREDKKEQGAPKAKKGSASQRSKSVAPAPKRAPSRKPTMGEAFKQFVKQ